MTTCLAVIAHDKAGPTIADFGPQWEKLGVPILGFMPKGQQWPGEHAHKVYHYGVSAHRGIAVFDRFLNVCETLMRTDCGRFVVIEYDTLNRNNDLPNFEAGICASWSVTYGPLVQRATGHEKYGLAFSPWCIERASMPGFIDAMKWRLANPFAGEWVTGLLDRWIATVVIGARLPYHHLVESCGWTHNNAGIYEAIAKHNLTWVHGWKTKEEFKDLWPTKQQS